MRMFSREFSIGVRRARRRASALRHDERGMIAVEFALLIPIAVLILVSEFVLGEAISISRKAALTGRTITDLVARRAAVSPSDVDTILNASAKIIAPFPTNGMTIVLAQLSTDAGGATTVSWSRSFNGTALVKGEPFTPPTGMAQPSTSLIFAEVRYAYTPPFATRMISSVPIRYAFYINPRVTSSVQLTN